MMMKLLAMIAAATVAFSALAFGAYAYHHQCDWKQMVLNSHTCANTEDGAPEPAAVAPAETTDAEPNDSKGESKH